MYMCVCVCVCFLTKVLKYNACQNLVFCIFPSTSSGKCGRRNVEVTSHTNAPQISFDMHVLMTAQDTMETKVNVNGVILRLLSTFCYLKNFLCPLEENAAPFSNKLFQLNLASLN